jgi:hypothetical protein
MAYLQYQQNPLPDIKASVPVRTSTGVITDDFERKKIATSSTLFCNTILFDFDTVNRSAGSVAQPQFFLQKPVTQCYGVSLRHAQIPNSWGNLLVAKTLEVKYSNVVAYPLDIVISAGNWNYDIEGGTITYATAAAAPITDFTDNIIYQILRQFAGAVDSIGVNASTGVWTWIWNAACGTVTPVSGQSFYKITFTNGGPPSVWLSSGAPDLTGPKKLMIQMNQLPSNGFALPNTSSQSYLCSVPIDAGFSEVIHHEPYFEQVIQFQHPVNFSFMSFGLVDPTTGLALPATIDWSCEIKLYVISTNLQ